MALPLLAAIIPTLISTGVGIAQSSIAAKKRKEAEEEAKRQLAKRPDYTPSERVNEALEETRVRRNAISPAVLMAYQQAQQQAADTRGAIERNATSGSEALAMNSAAQSALYNLLPQLAQAQQNYSDNRMNDYYRALQGAVRQDELVAADRNAKYADLVNFHLGRLGAANTGLGQGLNLAAQGLAALGSTVSVYNPSTGKYEWAWKK